MKKFKITLIILAVLAGILIATCPSRQDHKEAVAEVLEEAYSQQLARSDNILVNLLGGFLGDPMIKTVLDRMLVVKRYGVCSVGYLRYDGEERVVSIGLLHYVQVLFSSDQLLDAMEQKELLQPEEE